MPSTRQPVGGRHVAATFRWLAEEYAAHRERTDRRSAWQLLQGLRKGWPDRRGLPWLFSWALLPLALVVGAVGAAATAGLLWPSGLTYAVQGAEVQGGWIQTVADTAVLRFSDDGRIEMRERTRLQVELAGDQAALARLATGKLRAEIVNRKGTVWRFFAGPFEVQVIGTRFDLAWDAESEALSLSLHEGKVRVVGPNGLDRMVSAGQKLAVPGLAVPGLSVPGLSVPGLSVPGRVAPRLVAASDARSAAEGMPVDPRAIEPEPRPRRPATAPPRAGAPRARPTTPQKSEDQGWAALVARGKFAEVVDQAQRRGIDASLSSASLVDLKALAHAAHYTGRSSLSLRAWSALRDRGGESAVSKQAAFFLGRIFDEQNRSSLALRWLETYLAESPSGVYASEALGRQLTLIKRTRGTNAARRKAHEYLKRFPEGTYARTARALVGSD